MSIRPGMIEKFTAALAAFLFFNTGLAYGALVFSINGFEASNINLGTVTPGSPTQLLTVGVRNDAIESNTSHIVSFGFSLRSTNPAVASFTAVTFANPGNITGGATSMGATASASGTFTSRVLANSGIVNLATFTLQGFSIGSTSIFIDERTLGDNDFLFSSSLTTDPNFGQDRTGFSGPGTIVVGTATTSASVVSSITAVPEPSSLLMIGSVLGGLVCKRFRRTKRNEK